jgi:exonuclease SbcD
VHLERGATTYEFIELNVRPFVTIKVDARKKADPTQAVIDAIGKHDLTEAVVRVLIQTTPETDTLIRQRDIDSALSEAGFVAAVQREVEYAVRARLGVERPEGMAPLELLDLYLVKKDTPPDRVEVIKEYAEQIMQNPENPQGAG